MKMITALFSVHCEESLASLLSVLNLVLPMLLRSKIAVVLSDRTATVLPLKDSLKD